MLTRTLSGAVLIVLMFGMLHFGGYVLLIGLLAMSLIGLGELFHTFSVGSMVPFSKTGYILCVLYYGMLALLGPESLRNGAVFYAIALMAVVLMTQRVIVYPAHSITDVMSVFWGEIYIPVLFSFLYFLRMQQDGRFLVWFVFLSSWGCDTAAYLAGRAFGRHKLCVKLSPKKTVEGAVGGVLGAVLLCVVYAICIRTYVQMDTTALVILSLCMGFFGSILAQIGDLFASSVKRQMGIKDYGHLIPGHGGILDRFDSTLMVAPVLMIVFDLVGKLLLSV